MKLPTIEMVDLNIGDEEVDQKIWLHESLDKLEQEQPLLAKYLSIVQRENGEAACLTGLLVFKALNNAYERCGFYDD